MGRGSNDSGTDLKTSPEARQFAEIKEAAGSLSGLVKRVRSSSAQLEALQPAEEVLAYYQVDPGSITMTEIQRADTLLRAELEAEQLA